MSPAVGVLLLALMSFCSADYDIYQLEELCSDVTYTECEGGYKLSDGHCVMVHTDLVTFEAAKAECEGKGAHLVTVKSEEAFKEILCLVGMLSSTRIHYWLGAQREEDGFSWLDGSPMEYANWRSGQPDNWKDNENCVTMNSGSWGPWNDESCEDESGFICVLS